MPLREPGQDVVYLIAPSGHPNYGDELIAAAWLKFLAARRPHSLVVLDCHTPGQASVLLSGIHPNVVFVDTVWRLAVEASTRTPEDADDFLHNVVGDPGRACLIVDGISILSQASSIHILGGGYINGVWPHHYALLTLVMSAQQHSGARIYATGQGLMPLGNEAVVSKAADIFDVFDVRDEPSAQIAGTVLTGDDAWLDKTQQPRRGVVGEAARRQVLLCLQADLTGSDDGAETLAGMVRTMLDDWAVPGTDVAVIEAIPGTDRVVFDRLGDRLDGAVFVPFTELWRLGFPARADQTWISTRFHPHLLAAATGTSGVAISGQRGYYDTKHQSLLDLGSGWELVHVGGETPTTKPTNGGFAPEQVAALRKAKQELAHALYPPRSLTDTARDLTPTVVRRAVGRGKRALKL
ncbi:polysaccharide pyruvyl transferase family protein [Hoyosella rhizosphaerae]|nr:polysaccharide pyruvyl transferase family protein [Hoyosella rhizosphaerae]MBN4925450.1 polysaccharide pyruvyl transferase family protein [Hoyosella rhizosphaerae]